MFKLVMAAVENMVVGKEYYEHCSNHLRNHTSPFSHGVCQPCSHDWDSGDSKIKGSEKGSEYDGQNLRDVARHDQEEDTGSTDLQEPWVATKARHF